MGALLGRTSYRSKPRNPDLASSSWLAITPSVRYPASLNDSTSDGSSAVITSRQSVTYLPLRSETIEGTVQANWAVTSSNSAPSSASRSIVGEVGRG